MRAGWEGRGAVHQAAGGCAVCRGSGPPGCGWRSGSDGHEPMDDMTQKPATAARIYDYYLGGVHNFPADREAAKQVIAVYPFIPAAARANRAFLGRAVRAL